MFFRTLTWVTLSTALLFGCGGAPSDEPGEVGSPAPLGPELNLAAGTYSDGSNRLGLALLATLRDADGKGPSVPWTLRLGDERGPLEATAIYPEGGTGSHVALWWADVPYAAGSRVWVRAEDGAGNQLERSIVLPLPGGLAAPSLALAADASTLSWSPVAAASYDCEVSQEGALQLSLRLTGSSCDLSALPDGSYVARVRAYSFTPDLLAERAGQRPTLPERFDVAESVVGFSSTAGSEAVALRAAGGAIHYSSSASGLAVWLSLRGTGGALLTAPATVEVFGGALRPESPLRFEYPAGAGGHLIWAYDVPAMSAQYTVSALLDGRKVTTRFTVGDLGVLSLPRGVAVSPSSSGGATVTFAPVAGARAYYVGAWSQVTGALVAGQWTAGSPVEFPSQTFVRGASYDVYVAATDVDMTSDGSAPSTVSVSEDSFSPVRFTSP